MQTLDRDKIKEWYVSNFNRFRDRLNGEKESFFFEIRQDAISRFSRLGFPNSQNEEWKYTNISPLLEHQFQLETKRPNFDNLNLNKFLIDGLTGNLLVFVNGIFAPELSNAGSNLSGLIIGNLSDLILEHPELAEKYLSKFSDYKNDAFTALNTAFALEGAAIIIPENTQMEKPIQILNISGMNKSNLVSFPRNLFLVGKNSNVQVVESSIHLSNNIYFNNTVSEIIIQENGAMDYYKIQDEDTKSYLISNTYVHQHKDSRFKSINIDLGGAIVRNNLNIKMAGENCETDLFGFYITTGSQLIDNNTNITHEKPNGTSKELYKGILDGKSKGVFSGTVLVERDAQKTSAFQGNKNLLLSADAEINSKPQLKILADDVRCTHGATIGQIDEEALFYLRQRGLSKKNALDLLHYAFAADVFKNISLNPVRDKVDRLVKNKFAQLNQDK